MAPIDTDQEPTDEQMKQLGRDSIELSLSSEHGHRQRRQNSFHDEDGLPRFPDFSDFAEIAQGGSLTDAAIAQHSSPASPTFSGHPLTNHLNPLNRHFSEPPTTHFDHPSSLSTPHITLSPSEGWDITTSNNRSPMAKLAHGVSTGRSLRQQGHLFNQSSERNLDRPGVPSPLTQAVGTVDQGTFEKETMQVPESFTEGHMNAPGVPFNTDDHLNPNSNDFYNTGYRGGNSMYGGQPQSQAAIAVSDKWLLKHLKVVAPSVSEPAASSPSVGAMQLYLPWSPQSSGDQLNVPNQPFSHAGINPIPYHSGFTDHSLNALHQSHDAPPQTQPFFEQTQTPFHHVQPSTMPHRFQIPYDPNDGTYSALPKVTWSSRDYPNSHHDYPNKSQDYSESPSMVHTTQGGLYHHDTSTSMLPNINQPFQPPINRQNLPQTRPGMIRSILPPLPPLVDAIGIRYKSWSEACDAKAGRQGQLAILDRTSPVDFNEEQYYVKKLIYAMNDMSQPEDNEPMQFMWKKLMANRNAVEDAAWDLFVS